MHSDGGISIPAAQTDAPREADIFNNSDGLIHQTPLLLS